MWYKTSNDKLITILCLTDLIVHLSHILYCVFLISFQFWYHIIHVSQILLLFFSGALDDNDNTCSQPVKKIKTEHLDETKSLEYCRQDKDSSCNSSKVKCEPDNHETERKINPAFVQIVVPKKEVSEIMCPVPLVASCDFCLHSG